MKSHHFYACIVLAVIPFSSSYDARCLRPTVPDYQRTNLRLRGGMGIASNPRSASSVAAAAATAASNAEDNTAFIKITWKAKGLETAPRQVEICGSWSQFKARHPLSRMTNGDWEVIMELPKGTHQLKFVVDQIWKVSPDMEIRTDPAGNQNNIIAVDSVVRPTRIAAQQKERAPAVFVPASESIDIAKDMVQRLEQEQKLTQEKLAKAHSQLVETIKIELSEGVKALQKGLVQVNTFSEKGTAGLTNVKASGSAKITEIQAHMSKIRAILDQKESVAIAAVTENLTKRVAKLESEMQLYQQNQPRLQTLMEEAATLLKQSASDPQGFVSASQQLLPKIEKASQEAAGLAPPTDNASFDSLQLNLLPPTG